MSYDLDANGNKVFYEPGYIEVSISCEDGNQSINEKK